MHIRSPVIATLGHVDHGKTKLLDSIRGSNVTAKEPGAITQMIGASYITKKTINNLSKTLAKAMQVELKIPGLLFIDTPGHEAFTNLRERGGSIADMAILVVDITQGVQPQTIESIKILKQYKTPFVVAANKIDVLHGWKSYKTTSFLESYAKQPEHIRNTLDEKLYTFMGSLSTYGFDSERFDRIEDFTKQIAILPVSAKTKEGLSELLVLIAGLSQKFLETKLQVDPKSKAKGSILEVKEEKGLGTTLDVIIYDGILQKNNEIAFLTNEGVRTTKIRGLLEPNIKGKEKFRYVDEVVAAAGVKIFAPGLEGALAGSPIKAVEDLNKDKAELELQFKKLLVEKEELGVILCADSLGSLEALIRLLGRAGIAIKETKVGKITRKEILSARAVSIENRYLGAVLGFNVPILPEAREESKDSAVPLIWSNIIYDLLDQYNAWIKEEKEKERQAMATLPWPAKMRVLPGFCFRVNNPAIFGIEILAGKIKTGIFLMDDKGNRLGEIKGIQKEKEPINEASTGMQIAIACEGVTYGKDIKENTVLYTWLNTEALARWEKQSEFLGPEEKELLSEIKKCLGAYF